MPGRKKSGRITLRMDEKFHARAAKAAQALGLDLNGLLNVIIRTNLFHYEAIGESLSDPKTAALYRRWLSLNPGIENVLAFLADLATMRTGTTRLFQSGQWYRLNKNGDDFDRISPPFTFTVPPPPDSPGFHPDEVEEDES